MRTETQLPVMTERPGLLTETECEAITGKRSGFSWYKTFSYFLNRVKEIRTDVKVLKRYTVNPLGEPREIVYNGGSDE